MNTWDVVTYLCANINDDLGKQTAFDLDDE